MLEYVGGILSILYLVITPFLWRKLLNLLEKLGWMAGIVTSLTSQGLLILGGSHPTIKWSVFIGGIVILVITGIFHLKSSKSEKSEKYDAKKLNNNIFRKLARIEFTEDWEGRLTFKIPKDERAFAHRNSGTYTSWIIDSVGHERESDFNQIENAIPDLNIGEKYLKSSYPNVYEKWQEIKKIVDEYNEKREDFINKLGSMFEKEFNSQFPDFMEHGTVEKNLKKRFYFPKKNFGKNVYRLDEIEKLLYKTLTINSEDKSSSTFSRLSLQKDSYDDHYWWSLALGNSRLMTVEDSKKMDIEKIRKILVNITNDFKTIQQFFDVRLLLDPSKIDKLYDFREKIEDEVVSDIDNQV